MFCTQYYTWSNDALKTASLKHFERKMGIFVAILCILFGIVFPFGSAYTGEYYFVTINIGMFLRTSKLL